MNTEEKRWYVFVDHDADGRFLKVYYRADPGQIQITDGSVTTLRVIDEPLAGLKAARQLTNRLKRFGAGLPRMVGRGRKYGNSRKQMQALFVDRTPPNCPNRPFDFS